MMMTTVERTGRVRLYEQTLQTGSRVDRSIGVIKGVKIIGSRSRNGRVYSAAALSEGARLYEDKRVMINHPDRADPTRERGVGEQFGVLRNVVKRGSAVYGDLYFVKSHPLAAQVCEMAETMHQQLGLSHNAEGHVSRHGEELVVESIAAVHSVDLVLNPATNAGLFESVEREATHRANLISLINDVFDLAVTRVQRDAGLTQQRRLDRIKALMEAERAAVQAIERNAPDAEAEFASSADAEEELQVTDANIPGSVPESCTLQSTADFQALLGEGRYTRRRAQIVESIQEAADGKKFKDPERERFIHDILGF